MNESSINHILKDILNKASERITANDYLSAETILREGVALDKHNPELLFNLSVVLLKQKRAVEAEEHLQTILSLPFSSVDIIQVKTLLCYSYLERKELEKCSTQLISLLKLSPNNITALSLLGYYYELSNKIPKAIDIYKKIISINKENLNAHNSYAFLTAHQNGDLNSALTSARYCISKQADNPAYCDTIGFIYAKLGETGLATKFLKKAVALLPENEQVRAHLHELLKI